ncbi:MAG: Tol-Pal system protein TolB [Nitrospirae bacterium]|nr:Tol-Pal system protein TolB [Magnetococcales bacterium]HAT49238.1 Tol-Pal system protein TolB [Alphaproteobacteria bacterium]
MKKLRIAVFSLLFLAYGVPAYGALSIDITKGGLQPLPIALSDFVDLSPDGTASPQGTSGHRINEVVTADLERSGLFKPLDPTTFLQTPVELWQQGPNFRDWRLIGADAVVSGAVHEKDGKLIADFFLHDVYQGSLVGKGKRFTAPVRDWRHVAHRIADEIYTRLTGESGYFTSRIAFVANKGDMKWLALMDQDGANRVDLTRDRTIVLTPRFAPAGEQLFYLSYERGPPRIFRWDLYTGKRTIQGDYPGLNSAPAWSPNGRSMAVTLSMDGNSEIYLRDIDGGGLRRLTENSAIDTSPSFSPDGSQIVFNSDRGGSPQIYVMDAADGGNVRRLTFEGSYNAAPCWSPRGDYIAYVSGGGGRFRISVIDPKGQNSRALTDSWMDESPTWSPNGRVILFSRQAGNQTRLYTVDLTGHNERLVSLDDDLNGSDPSWSPLIR